MTTNIIPSLLLSLIATASMACDVDSSSEPRHDSLQDVELLDVRPTEDRQGHALTLAVTNHSDRELPMPTVEYAVEVDGVVMEVGMVPLDGRVEALAEEEVDLTIESALSDPDASFDVDVVEWSVDEPRFRAALTCEAWMAMCDSKMDKCTGGVKSYEVGCSPNYCRITCYPSAF